MTPVRFAILGFGHHAAFRLMPSFPAAGRVELAGLWRRDATKAAADAERFSTRAFGSAEELCASPDVDAVFITSPDAVHLRDAELAFARGKAVLCEKPLTGNSADADAMLAAALRAGLLFGVAHHYRWAASVQAMREQVAGGLIGEPRTAHAEFNYAAQFSKRTWITDPALAAGGPIGDVGVHCLDTLRFILGDAAVHSVSTAATQDELSGDVEASAVLQLEMSGNVLGSVSVSARAAYRTAVAVVGSEGVLVAENGMTVDQPVTVEHRRGGKAVSSRSFDNADAYTRMMDNFAAALTDGEPFLAPGVVGVENQHALTAAYASWRSGRREAVQPVRTA